MTKKSDLVACIVMRDYWDDDGNRVRKGSGVEVTPDEAMTGIEEGTLERAEK